MRKLGKEAMDEGAQQMNTVIRKPEFRAFNVHGADGRTLLSLRFDGTVEGTIEDASEAAVVFVRTLREQWGVTSKAPVTVGQLRAAVASERSLADLAGYFDGGSGTREDCEKARAETDALIAALAGQSEVADEHN